MLNSFWRLVSIAALTAWMLPHAALGQDNVNQAANSASPGNAANSAVARGQLAFTQNCAFCHGPEAHGGAEGGVDLTRSTIVMDDPTEAPLIAFLKVGRPPRMPSFNNLSDEQVRDIAAFVRTQAAPAAGRGGRQTVVAIVGDAQKGEQFFNGAGKCNTCHSVTGDLKGMGSKYSALILQGRIVLPRGTGGYPGLSFGPPPEGVPPDKPLSVTVTEADGKTTSGDLVAISDFLVVLKDSDGVTHTFARNGNTPKVELRDPLQAHLDLLPKLTNDEMHDLTAYLVTLK